MTQRMLDIPKWKPETMAPDATCLAVGKRHAGKTTLLSDVMFHLKDRLDLAVGFCGTESASNPVLGRFLPPCFIYDHFDEAKIQHLMDWQRRACSNSKAMRVGLILDDLMGETSGGKKVKVMSSGEVGKIFKIGRHRKVFFWCTLQYMRDCPPDARNNTDLLFLYNVPSDAERQKVHKDFFGMVPNYRDFVTILDMCTQGYSCLVLDTRLAMRGEQCIFHYQAKIRSEPFRVGRDIFWKLSSHFFVDRADNEMDVSRVLGIDPLENTSQNVQRGRQLIMRKIDDDEDAPKKKTRFASDSPQRHGSPSRH